MSRHLTGRPLGTAPQVFAARVGSVSLTSKGRINKLALYLLGQYLVPIRTAQSIPNIHAPNLTTLVACYKMGFIERTPEELRARIVEQAPPEYLPMLEATMKLGVSRQTVLQRVKRGELQAKLVTCGRRKGLQIKVVDDQPCLFATTS